MYLTCAYLSTFTQPGGMILCVGLDAHSHFHRAVYAELDCKVLAVALVQLDPQTQHPLDFE